MLAEATAYKKNWQKAQRARLKDGCVNDSYMYVHLEADSGEPFYVGIGYTHTRPWEKSNRTGKHKNRANKHGNRQELIIDEIHWENAKWWEVRWIKALREAGYNLVNLTDGGDGTKGHKHTEEYCKQISKRMTEINPHHIPEVAEKLAGDNHWSKQYGAVTNFHTENNPSKKPENIDRMLCNNPMQNPETAERVAQQNRGRKMPDGFGEDVSKRFKGVPKTEEHNAKNSAGVKASWDSLTEDEKRHRGFLIKKGRDKKTPEERSLIIAKGHETRRRNKLLKEGVE